jgi:hypothetical protein
MNAGFSERRNTLRLLPHCHIGYRRAVDQPAVMEEGQWHDVSSTGCQFITEAALQPGQIITLILYFSDGPISLPGTTVCWARAHRFGVRFADMTPHERERLEEFVRGDETVVAPCKLHLIDRTRHTRVQV